MALNKVTIDMPLILDPHKLLILLAGLDRTHEEILVPDVLRFIEVWEPPGGVFVPPFVGSMTLRILEEDFDEKLDEIFGFDTRSIASDNFCAGIRLFRYAYDHDMVTLFDSQRYTTIGQEVLKTDKFYPPFYRLALPSGKFVNINPDLPFALESLIGVEEDMGAVPIFGDLDFLRYITEKKPEGTIRQHEGVLTVDEQTKILLDCPQSVSFEELIWFVQNRDTFNAVSDKLKFGNEWQLTTKDVGIMGLKFGGTLTTDIALFGGAPVTSGGLFVYELLSRVIRVTKNKDKKS